MKIGQALLHAITVHTLTRTEVSIAMTTLIILVPDMERENLNEM